MYRLLHLLCSRETFSEYEDAQDLENACLRYGCDGFEVIRAGHDGGPFLRPGAVVGYHLPFYANWMDFWMENQTGLRDEFGSPSVWEDFYGGKTPEALVDLFRREMDDARSMGAHYTVFHVSNVTTREGFTYRFGYTDRQVVDAAADLLNRALSGMPADGPELLLENLWWPGLNYRDPAVTARLLERVRYPRAGLLLDTGHLMCTNPGLADQEEACRYIHRILDRHGSLCRRIRGVHLHQSVTGAYVKSALHNRPVLHREFYARFAQAYEHVLKIDTHQVMTCPGVPALIERIAPAYLTYEFTAATRAERERRLREQSAVFGLVPSTQPEKE